MIVRELMAKSVFSFRLTGLFLVKPQVFTINSSEGFCYRDCNGICLWLQNMSDLYLGLQGYNFIKKESPTQMLSSQCYKLFVISFSIAFGDLSRGEIVNPLLKL